MHQNIGTDKEPARQAERLNILLLPMLANLITNLPHKQHPFPTYVLHLPDQCPKRPLPILTAGQYCLKSLVPMILKRYSPREPEFTQLPLHKARYPD